MAWTEYGSAVTVSGAPESKATTSTSTLLVRNQSRLRMYYARAELEFQSFTPTAAPTVLDGGTYPVGYIDSDASFYFDAVTASDFALTAVPGVKGPVPRIYPDGTVLDSYVRYQDPHVLRLPRGMGYLMVLGEYIREWDETLTADTEDDPGMTNNDLNCTASDTVSFIVGFWSADPTFEDCKGPYWVVGRNQEVAGVVCPIWLGVPSTVVVDVAGTEYLYLYFVAEASDIDWLSESAAATEGYGFEKGVWARRIRLKGFMESIDEDYVERDDGGGPDLDPEDFNPFAGWGSGPRPSGIDPSILRKRRTWVEEEDWDPAADNFLVRGLDLGKVAVWVATGVDWSSGGNTEFEAHYDGVKIVDPVAVVSNEGGSGQRLMLYFAANADGLYSGTMGFGAWCAPAVPEGESAVYGADFVVADGVDPATDVGESNLVAPGALDSRGEYMEEGRLDPDPTELPDGSWVVHVGAVFAVNSIPPALTIQAMLRVEGDSGDGAPDPSSPWA